jgi:type IV secretory pathway VirB10-like protein
MARTTNSIRPRTAPPPTAWPACRATIQWPRQLGPPLPGDLGRPILSAQNAASPSCRPAMATPARHQPEEQRRLQEIEAARTSRCSSSRRPGHTRNSWELPQLPALPDSKPWARSAARPPSAQDRQLAFLNARSIAAPSRPIASPRPASPYILQAGAVIPAALITGIRSDLPGQITAQVTENIYDSPTGRILLSRRARASSASTTTTCSSASAACCWSGTGSSCRTAARSFWSASPARTRRLCRAAGWRRLPLVGSAKAAGLSTLLGVGAELATDDDDRLIRAIRNGAQDTINDAGQQIVRASSTSRRR